MYNRLDILNDIQSSANQLEKFCGKECSDNFMNNVANLQRQSIATDLSYDNQFIAIYDKYPGIDCEKRNEYLMNKNGLEREDRSLRFYDC